jgi:hypothetical protein
MKGRQRTSMEWILGSESIEWWTLTLDELNNLKIYESEFVFEIVSILWFSYEYEFDFDFDFNF